MNKIYIIGIIILCFFTIRLYAQDVSQKSYYSFERIESKTPWLASSNGAGLIYNKIENNISTVGGYFNSVSGDYRNYNQAQGVDNFGLETKSYTRLENLYFYGNFNYDYAMRTNQVWLGTTYANTNINPMLDSIPGKNIREAYNIDFKVAYKFSELFSVGAVFNYKAATSVKRIDGRNKNDFSNLYVSPGISFTTKHINVGLNLSYGHNAEQVIYNYFGDVTGKYICYMEGLFMYSTSPIVSSGYVKERRYEKDIFGGSAQLELKFEEFTFYNNLSVLYGKENDYEDSMLKRRYAIVNTLNYDYMGELKYSTNYMDNSLIIRYSNKEDLSYGIVNNYEPVPDEKNLWEYYEYGKVLRYMSQMRQYGVEYKGFVKKDDYLSKIDFTIGYNYIKLDKTEKVFPAEYNQNNKISDYYANVNKNFASSSSIIKLNICGGYSSGSGGPLTESNPLTTGALKLNKMLLAHDYAYRVSDNYRIGGGVNYSYIINRQKGQVLSLGVNYLYRKVTNVRKNVYEVYPQFAGFENNKRNSINITLNFNF